MILEPSSIPPSGDKAILRREFRQLRDKLPVSERGRASAAICSQLLRMEPVMHAQVVFSYVSSGSEVDSRPLLRELLNRGVQVLVPSSHRCASPLGQLYQLPHQMEMGEELPKPAISHSLELKDVEVFLVPGLAWNTRGHRIGFGGGYFDKLLAAASPRAAAIGLCFKDQLTNLPTPEAWDIAMDYLVSEAGIIDCRLSRAKTDQ
jgi:5-formyltetrahydrofolate cyclo-ligase